MGVRNPIWSKQIFQNCLFIFKMKKNINNVVAILCILCLVYLFSSNTNFAFLKFRSNLIKVNVTFPQKMSVEETNQFRIRSIYRSCQKRKKNPPISSKTWSRIVVDDVNHLLYCYVPKVACTNWKRVLYILMGRTNHTNPLKINANLVHRPETFLTLNNFTEEEREKRMKSYKKFVFVRNPLDRLISAYQNKLSKKFSYSAYFQKRFGRFIVQKYRENPTEVAKEFGNDVTIAEFFKYLADPANYEKFNEHWTPQVDLCRPCHIHYDFIGHYEDIDREANYVIENLAGNSELKFPSGREKTCEGCNRKRMKEYLTKVPKDIVKSVIKVFQSDFNIFGYSMSMKNILKSSA